jgi:ribA/ribD-fused uncharacterized protein
MQARTDLAAYYLVANCSTRNLEDQSMGQGIKIDSDGVEVIEFRRSNEKPFGIFSNLYPRPVMFEGLEFPSAEHAYQAGKARSESVRAWLLSAPSPSLLAMAAHGLYSWDVVPNWAQIKYERMRAVLRAKFTQHADMREVLLSTGSTRLVETASVDNKVNREWATVNGKGQNMLGVLLMEIREELRMSMGSIFAVLSGADPQESRAVRHEAAERLKFYMFGYRELAPLVFLDALKRRSVRSLVDIRMWPTQGSMALCTLTNSPEEEIQRLLGSAGISYHSLLELGNPFRDLPDWKDRYSRLLESAANVLLERLIGIAGPICIVCVERDPQESHRVILAEFLRKRGYGVEHLVG